MAKLPPQVEEHDPLCCREVSGHAGSGEGSEGNKNPGRALIESGESLAEPLESEEHVEAAGEDASETWGHGSDVEEGEVALCEQHNVAKHREISAMIRTSSQSIFNPPPTESPINYSLINGGPPFRKRVARN
ncbi:unnamed protein product [Pleuronectes platessa]|uniref:Uncharacterized protein n=1 Tax=Pleuronectes platessa TaxID=8262 RepID=A0A9N7YDK2_PLEPL|nr:unnamed protein product [Pleuronectes platessa]